MEVTGLALWGAHPWQIMAGRVRAGTVPAEPLTPGGPISRHFRTPAANGAVNTGVSAAAANITVPENGWPADHKPGRA